MGTSKVETTCCFDEEDFDIDKLTAELIKHEVLPDSVLEIFEGEFQCFTAGFSKMLADVTCSASISFTRGCMYLSNGDPGYPDEEDFEDFFIGETFKLNGKPINIQDCLKKSALKRAEELLYETNNEY